MFCRSSFLFLAVAFLLVCAAANAQDFSIDAASPEVPGGGSEADIFWSGIGPPTVWIPGVNLGLLPALEELNAFSYGRDQLVPAGMAAWVNFFYSVDRATMGAGGAVTNQVTGNGAAGDQFRAVVDGTGAVLVPPVLWEDALGHGLSPLPVESDLDAHSHPFHQAAPVYFSVAPAAVATASVRWGMPGLTAADILYVAAPAPAVVPTVYATGVALGLVGADDVDAVAISDGGVIGTLNVGDVVYVSLAPGSPTLGVLPASAASVIQVFPGPMVVIFPPAALDLLPGDNLNAMTGYDPGPTQVPTLSGWSLLVTVLVLVMVGTILIVRRRVHVRV